MGKWIGNLAPYAALLAFLVNWFLGKYSVGREVYRRWFVSPVALFYALMISIRQFGNLSQESLILWSDTLLPLSGLIFLTVWSIDPIMDYVEHRQMQGVIKHHKDLCPDCYEE